MRDSLRKFSGLLAGALLGVLIAQPSHATGSCYQWVGAGLAASCTGYDIATVGACGCPLVGAATGAYDAAHYTGPGGSSRDPPSASNAGATASCEEDPNAYGSANGFSPQFPTVTMNAAGAACPCAIGQSADGQGASTASVTSLGGGSYCANGCEYKPVPTTLILSDGVHYAIGGAQTTGNACGSSTTPVTTGANCWMSHGETICIDADHGGATIQGDAIAMASAPGGGNCIGYASGGSLCTMPAGASTQPTPPAPDNGTAGTPATPTATVSQNGTTANYYNGTTTGNSSNPVVTQGNPNGTPKGTTAGATDGAASAAQPDDCGDGSACMGAVPTLPDQQDVATTTSSYTGSLGSVPIVAAVQNISAAIPPGVCPTGAFTVYGTTYTIDEQCTLWDSVAGIVQACMMAVWLFMGIRILMSA